VVTHNGWIMYTRALATGNPICLYLTAPVYNIQGIYLVCHALVNPLCSFSSRNNPSNYTARIEQVEQDYGLPGVTLQRAGRTCFILDVQFYVK